MEQIAQEEGLRFFVLQRIKRSGDSSVWLCPDCKNPIQTETYYISDAEALGAVLFGNSDLFLPIPVQKVELNVDLQGKCLNCGCQTPIKP
jgi:hypothetical protein